MRMTREQTQTELLSLVDVLEPLSKEELEELAARCPDIRLKRGEDFYRPEEHDGGLFLIKEGRVQIYKLTPTGKQLTLVLLSAGTALSSRRLQGLHAQALKPSVIAFMKREELERLIHESPEVGLRLADLLAERLRLMDERMADVIHKAVPAPSTDEVALEMLRGDSNSGAFMAEYERLREEGMGVEQAMIFVGHEFRLRHLRYQPVG